MNWDRIEGNWKQWTGRAKSQWGKLTDDALTQAGGHRDQLVGKIQEAYGISKDEAERQVNDWSSSLDRAQGGREQSGREQGGYGAQGSYRSESMPQDWERTGREVASQVERTGREVYSQAERWAGEARRGMERSSDALETRIQEQPFTSIALAAAIGFILGVLASRG